MAATTPSDLVITPATWPSQKNKLEETPTNLLNLVGWYGSTHAAAMWRKAAEFLAVFRQASVPGFDPQIEGWDPAYAAVEAEVLADAAVIVIRLENHELVNGSLGSIAEVGLALTSAALRGQVVIVSIEDNLLASLNDPGAVAQYMILEMFMEEIDTNPIFSRFLQLHRGNDLAELAHLACIAARQQMEAAYTGLNFNDFLAKKNQRQQNYPLRVLLGGSGGPYTQAYRNTFEQKIKRLAAPYTGDGYVLSILSEGAVAEAWDIPYRSPDPFSTGLAMRTLLSIELESKKGADKLLLPIVAEASSKAAATEIGFLLLFALTTGQDVSIFLEPFDPVDFIRHYLSQVEIKADADEKSMRAALDRAGVPHAVLATAAQAEVTETCALIQTLLRGETATFKQVKQSLLGRTEAFQAADNIRRVRVLVQAHLEKLHTDLRYPDFFSYITQI
ncbi:MAG: hypothetical protein HS126_19405 [Anaerolineales bacterium]|nr:hypothetical protein [Anaerolineales bacterium]